MGNIWGSERNIPVNGTYLDDRPRRRPGRHVRKPLEEPLLEAEAEPEVPAAPKEHWKEKALRIFHHLAERSRTFNRGMLLQTEG
jgi:hypothetical protein